MPYSPVTVIGYNANPPADDGTQVGTNEITWAKHIEKIGGPLKTALESIDSNVEDIVLDIEASIATLQTSLSAAAGTKLLFPDTVPSGWTTDTTHNNKALRLTSSSPGTAAGTSSFTSVFTNRTITTAMLPNNSLSFSLTAAAHTHSNGSYYAIGHTHGYGSYYAQSHSHASGTYTVASHSHSDGSYYCNSHTHGDGSYECTSTYTTLSVNSSKRTNNQGSQNVNYSISRSDRSVSGTSSSTTPGVSGTSGTSAPDVTGTSSASGNVSVFGTSGDSGTVDVQGTSSSSGPHTVSGSISLGGSGSSFGFAVQYVDVVIATKD